MKYLRRIKIQTHEIKKSKCHPYAIKYQKCQSHAIKKLKKKKKLKPCNGKTNLNSNVLKKTIKIKLKIKSH